MFGKDVLFGKYRLCRKLGSGRSGTVYLTYHVELEEYRALKIVPKTMSDYDTFRKEALFLKTLRHPGIPIVYDLEEDSENSYLIEEYLEGESLYALVKRLGVLSIETAADIGIQVCRLIQFMNSAENPILYLDLQPKNLIICGETVRLTDFDHAQYETDVKSFGERYGTAGFAAPEQYSGEPLDCRADVYAIGALLYYMCQGMPPGRKPDCGKLGDSREFGRIVRGCMAPKKEERYQAAADVEAALADFKAGISNEHAIKSQIIIFAGTKPGIGTTHAALGMSDFLIRSGHMTLYQEEYDTNTVRSLARSKGVRADSFGVYHIGCLNIRPYYGSSVRMPYLYFPIIIKDMGTSWKQAARLPEAGLFVLVCGGKWWELDETVNTARKLHGSQNVLLLFNHMTEDFKLSLPEDIRALPRLYLPFFPNPLKENRDADACFREIKERGAKGKQKCGKRSWFGRIMEGKAD